MLVASLLLITSASVIYLLWAASSVPPSLLLLFFLMFQDSISYKYSTTQYNLLPLSVTRRRFQSQPASTPELDVIAIMSKSHKCHGLVCFHKVRSQCSQKEKWLWNQQCHKHTMQYSTVDQPKSNSEVPGKRSAVSMQYSQTIDSRCRTKYRAWLIEHECLQ